jgi:hypothetical protein
MSGRLHLPPVEPPAEDVERVLDQLRFAHEQLAAAQERAHRAQLFVERGAVLGHRDSIVLRVMLAARSHEVDLWAEAISELVDEARKLGLQP